MDQPSVYVSGYINILKILLKTSESKNFMTCTPREVIFHSIRSLSTNNDCWGFIVQTIGAKLKIYGCSSVAFDYPVEIPLSYSPQLAACSDKVFILIDDNGSCLVWNSIEDFIRKPSNPVSSIKSSNKQKLSFSNAISNDITTLLISSDDRIFKLSHLENVWKMSELLPFNHKVDKIACGKEHQVILTENGLVFSFGLGSRGQLGHGTVEDEPEPKLIEALHGIKISSISCGGWHSAAVSDIGDIYIWGWNESGQLGCSELQPFSTKRTSQLENDALFKALPHLITFPSDEFIKKVSCGSRHTASLTSEGRLYMWGWNKYGQLCTSDFNDRHRPSMVSSLGDSKVIDILAIGWSTFMSVSK